MLYVLLSLFIVQLHFAEYKQRPKRVQISRDICTPEDRLDRFPAVDQSVSRISRANSVPPRIILPRIPCKQISAKFARTNTTIWRVG